MGLIVAGRPRFRSSISPVEAWQVAGGAHSHATVVVVDTLTVRGLSRGFGNLVVLKKVHFSLDGARSTPWWGRTAPARPPCSGAPFTAEEAWQRLGNKASLCDHGWPTADPALVVEESVTCIIQVNGKVRDRVDVRADIDEESLRELALGSAKVRQAVAHHEMVNIIVRVPKLVNVVSPTAR